MAIRICFLTFLLLALSMCLVFLPVIRTYFQTPVKTPPEAILILGGGAGNREEDGMRIAESQYPEADLWVSSGGDRDTIRAKARTLGIEQGRLFLDYSAVDTVTNFTTLFDTFVKKGYQHIMVITDDVHMPRAKAIGKVIFVSSGMTLSSTELPSDFDQEGYVRTVRDYLRSVFWYYTGYAGSSFSGRHS